MFRDGRLEIVRYEILWHGTIEFQSMDDSCDKGCDLFIRKNFRIHFAAEAKGSSKCVDLFYTSGLRICQQFWPVSDSVDVHTLFRDALHRHGYLFLSEVSEMKSL